MAEGILPLALGIAVGLVLGYLWHQLWKLRHSAAIRRDAVVRSRAVTAGKVLEQLVPYLPGFPYHPGDVRFLGSPVDLVVFDGLSDGDVERVVFVEVKTGGSRLTRRERQVRGAVEAGKVEWLELDVPGDGTIR
jgi:predicted Holliday junction resolvase-like endonuclease